jgi:hypothetical protein
VSDRDVVLVFVDALNRVQAGDETPILIPDLQAHIREASYRKFDVADLGTTTPTLLFHLLRQLVEEGLVARGPTGYLVTDVGRNEVERLRAAAADQIDNVDEAAASAFERAS